MTIANEKTRPLTIEEKLDRVINEQLFLRRYLQRLECYWADTYGELKTEVLRTRRLEGVDKL